MTPNDDLITNGIIYTCAAGIAYLMFGASQVFRMHYIAEMASPSARLANKFLEYLTLLISAMLLLFIRDYHGIIYYMVDLLLLALFVHQFIKNDRLQRNEYLRHYNNSKHKLINRMIMNLIHYPTHHDN